MACSAQRGIVKSIYRYDLCKMYFRQVVRTNPATGEIGSYYRLVESYRNENNRVCHRTLLTVGFINYPVEKLNIIQRILNDRLAHKKPLFEEQDQEALKWADNYWQQLISKRKIDVSVESYKRKRRSIDTDTMRHKDVREIGSEWMCYQAVEQLGIKEHLESKGWEEAKVQLAVTQIISRAVYPFSENRTSRWIKENSAVCEITGYDINNISKDKLYNSALGLYSIKDSLEQYLSKRTNELFDLDDKIILYDLTNTYFEGRKIKSILAQFGRSKEKRSDCKLVVLALVVNAQGFLKYSNIFEGNKSDSKSLPDIINKIRIKTSTEKRAIVVFDAGIATEENCKLIKENGFDYVCVSPTKIKDYQIELGRPICQITTTNKQKVSLQRILSDKYTDYIVKAQSEGKMLKEQSMKNQFEARFLQEIEKINAALTKRGGIKKVEKVNQRIGRALEKYPSMNKFYTIEVEQDGSIAKQVAAVQKEDYGALTEQLGVYFIRTSLIAEQEETLWTIYNTIREIESTFRCLKTDLDLRPIYHKNDDSTMAHLHLGLLAYWVVNTIRYQLKTKEINSGWQEIIRITNTQKIVTTTGQNSFDQTIQIRRCSQPNTQVEKIYSALGYKNYPFVKRKYVVPKTELKKNYTAISQTINDS